MWSHPTGWAVSCGGGFFRQMAQVKSSAGPAESGLSLAPKPPACDNGLPQASCCRFSVSTLRSLGSCESPSPQTSELYAVQSPTQLRPGCIQTIGLEYTVTQTIASGDYQKRDVPRQVLAIARQDEAQKIQSSWVTSFKSDIKGTRPLQKAT